MNRCLLIGYVLFFITFLLPAGTGQAQTTVDFTKYVNPFIGTDGTGHTFPGACVPFGMVQPGPDNRDVGWDYCSGYQYRDSLILGFTQTHLSGTGIGDLGDVLLQPFTGDRSTDFASRYDKKSEHATPAYYTVTLSDGVRVELTASGRVAMHRYTFPLRDSAHVLVDLQHGIRFLDTPLVQESSVGVLNEWTISGYCRTANWVNRKYYFVLVFNRPFHSVELPRRAGDNAPRYLLTFILDTTKVLIAKIALSTVNIAGAEKNLGEVTDWDFDNVRSAGAHLWNRYLSRIEIATKPAEMESFYTALYHVLIQPNNIADADGRYRGPDDNIHLAPEGAYYTTLSLWDVYRTAFPLYTIVAPEIVNGIVKTLLAHCRDAGFLPIFTCWGQENYCMIGNHAIPLITEAVSEGFEGFDHMDALRAMVKSTTENHKNSDWGIYNRYGYYPFDSVDNESVSRTLESGFDDYCVSLLAGKLGKDDVEQAYAKRAGFYKNLFDPATRMFRGKDSKGNWRTPFDPLAATSPMNNPGDYTEANAWQYFFTPAQFDPEGVAALLGGREAFTRQLDTFFTLRFPGQNKFLGQEAMIGQYAHGNEPSHHIAYLYRYSSTPWRADELVRKICREFYSNRPDGMIGNDDCGQMSAWYICGMLGIFPMNPANGTYLTVVPGADSAVIHLPEDKTLRISPVWLNRGGLRLRKVELNHEPLPSTLRYRQIMNGGLLIPTIE
jgi:predicted alpha-1,2-mannosidase